MLRRNIKKAPQHTKAMAVNTLIRPKVEYNSAVWDPYTKVIKGLEEFSTPERVCYLHHC
jgi:hypothetical protein